MDQEEADVAETNDGAGQNLVMSRRHVWRELMQRRAHSCVETLAQLRVDLSQRTHAVSAPPVATASDGPESAAAKASNSGLYEAIKLEQWMKEDRREREAKAEAELKALDDEIAAVRMKRRQIEYETHVAKVRLPAVKERPAQVYACSGKCARLRACQKLCVKCARPWRRKCCSTPAPQWPEWLAATQPYS